MKGCLSLFMDVKPKRFIVVDEMYVKANNLAMFFSAMNINRNEIVYATHPGTCL
ncbi:MAG: hypothetical protein QXY40_09370 [Candidatus Methanomethylicia archaeon]